jgi:hypothetical protein
MSRKVAWIAAGVAGLLAAGGVTAAAAAAAPPAAPPVAAPHWHIVFKSAKPDPASAFTAVVATGKTSGWAFDGTFGGPAGPTAWRRSGTTWKKAAFPGKITEEVVAAGAASPSDVWAFTQDFHTGGSRVLRWTHGKWAVAKTFSRQIGGASVLAGNDVWVFGEPVAPGSGLGAWHYNGHAWKQVGKNLLGGSALSATSVWAYSGTSVDHWNGGAWTGTSVKSLLPAKTTLNHPAVTGIIALSATNVYAIGNGNQMDEGGPTVILHYDGHKWARASKSASGNFGFGSGAFAAVTQQVSPDGSGGLWLPMPGLGGQRSFILHYTGGKLIAAKLPVSALGIGVGSISRIPGTTQQLAGGATYAAGNPGTSQFAVLLQYS